MARPSKSADVLQNEGKTHKTKAEIAERKAAENGCYTGRTMSEYTAVKASPIAHSTFIKVRDNLEAIGRNDALFEQCINRYCLMTADVASLEAERDELRKSSGNETRLNTVEREIRDYRRMLLEMEKENLLTVQSAARQVPVSQNEPLTSMGLLKSILAEDG